MKLWDNVVRMIRFLHRPYREEDDALKISDLYDQIAAIRRERGFSRYYACPLDVDVHESVYQRSERLQCSDIVRDELDRLHFEERVWLRRGDSGASSRVVITDPELDRLVGLASDSETPAVDTSALRSDTVIEMESAIAGINLSGGRGSPSGRVTSASTWLEVASPESVAKLYSVRPIASAERPACGERTALDLQELEARRKSVMARILCDIHKHPIKLVSRSSKHRKVEQLEMTPVREKVKLNITPSTLKGVGLKKTGYRSGHFIGFPKISIYSIKKSNPKMNSALKLQNKRSSTECRSGRRSSPAPVCARAERMCAIADRVCDSRGRPTDANLAGVRDSLMTSLKNRRTKISPDSDGSNK